MLQSICFKISFVFILLLDLYVISITLPSAKVL